MAYRWVQNGWIDRRTTEATIINVDKKRHSPQVGYHARQESRCRLGKDNPEMENQTGTSSIKALRKPEASRPLKSSRLTINGINWI